MKGGRIVGAVLLLLLLISMIRAIYLRRIWEIARIWAKIPPAVSPNLSSFFLPDTWGSSAHNVYADIVFLKVHGSPESVAFVASRGTETSTGKKPGTAECGSSDWYQMNPATIAPTNLAPCFGVERKFGMYTKAGVRVIPLENNVGGVIIRDERGYLHLAIYRTR